MALLRIGLALALVSAGSLTAAQRGGRVPLTSDDIEAIARLVMLEDTRTFEEATLSAFLDSKHPEVRRRAIVSVGRIIDAKEQRGAALLAARHGEKDPELLATIAWATGQVRDAGAVAWLAHLLTDSLTPPPAAREAAGALGKIRNADSRAALAKYLASAPMTDAAAPTVGEALLSIGRFNRGEDIAPIVRWIRSPNVEVRWRAAWALFRPRDPAAVPHLLALADDASGDVRYWAVRALAPPPAPARGRGADAAAAPPPPEPPVDPALAAQLSARLAVALKDPDRRVRTEALRALGGYDDDASFDAVMAAIESPDTWLSVSAAEALGRKAARAEAVVPKLAEAAALGKPLALRLTSLTPLVTMAPDQAIDIAAAIARMDSATARAAAVQALQRLGPPGKIKLDELTSQPGLKDLVPAAGGPRPAAPARTLADYRKLVERWVVPDYLGAPKPRAIWTFNRGEIEIELYPGDAPLATEYFVTLVNSGAIVGTEFGRLVPNFVAQQRTITGAFTLRDEVNRHGLTRGNLSWASSGLDTGRPGYTLGHTPQPHNEGDFTSLGRVIRGMDVVDRLELGDAVTRTRMIK